MKWNQISSAMAYGFGGIVGVNLGCLFCKFVTEFVSELLNDDKKEEDNDGED